MAAKTLAEVSTALQQTILKERMRSILCSSQKAASLVLSDSGPY